MIQSRDSLGFNLEWELQGNITPSLRFYRKEIPTRNGDLQEALSTIITASEVQAIRLVSFDRRQ